MENIENSFVDLPNPRKVIEDLQPYSAPLEGRRNLLRLDFNENTIGPSPLVLKSLREISRDEISVYPEYSGLKEKVVESLIKKNSNVNINSSEVGIFNGVDAAINAIFHAYGNFDDLMLTTSPTFATRLSANSEICTSPSCFPKKFTKAPNSIIFTTLPL